MIYSYSYTWIMASVDFLFPTLLLSELDTISLHSVKTNMSFIEDFLEMEEIFSGYHNNY